MFFAQLMVIAGWILNIAGNTWVVFIVLEMLLSAVFTGSKRPGLLAYWLVRIANLPVNSIRRLIPTMYRRVDLAPWLTLLLLVLVNTFVFRAMIYWGVLHRLQA
jgi:uncharacterized protein YggT (Ycf19 family)